MMAMQSVPGKSIGLGLCALLCVCVRLLPMPFF